MRGVDSELGVAFGAPILDEWRGHELSPLRMLDWAELERVALNDYKRRKLESYKENLDLLDEKNRDAEMIKAYRETNDMTAANLPAVETSAYKRDATGKVVARCLDDTCRAMLAIDEENVKCVRCGGPIEAIEDTQKVPYLQWWITTELGRLHAIHRSMRRAKPDLTLEGVDELFTKLGRDAIAEVSQRVGELSNPQLGNSSDPPQTETPEATTAAGA